MDHESLTMTLKQVLHEAPFSLRQLADEAGVSYDSMRAWAIRRRNPRQSSIASLSAALRRRGNLLIDLSDQLDSASRRRASRS